MENICILSDFDGTITKKDGLYSFIENYANGDWQSIEQLWADNKINSKECLIEEFKLIDNLSEELISDFVKTVDIDEYFCDFYKRIKENNIDFYIVSDGIDYFIAKILERHSIKNINVISNHGEFSGDNFVITFPNDYEGCINNAGTCKCKVLSDLRKKYEKIIYIGDGISDYCVASKADILYAKSRLIQYCIKNNIEYRAFENFSDIIFN